jgi:hypothetical protein
MVSPFVPPAVQMLALAGSIEKITGLPEAPPVAETVKLPSLTTGLAGLATKFVMAWLINALPVA